MLVQDSNHHTIRFFGRDRYKYIPIDTWQFQTLQRLVVIRYVDVEMWNMLWSTFRHRLLYHIFIYDSWSLEFLGVHQQEKFEDQLAGLLHWTIAPGLVWNRFSDKTIGVLVIHQSHCRWTMILFTVIQWFRHYHRLLNGMILIIIVHQFEIIHNGTMIVQPTSLKWLFALLLYKKRY